MSPVPVTTRSTTPIPIMKPVLGEDEQRAAADAIASGWVAQGPRVAAFEDAMASRLGATAGVAVSSCTAGLHLCLVHLGLGPGDEVVVPSLSFIATANVVRMVGATPVFADVDLASQNVTAATIAPRLTARTRAVIVVHQAGIPADVDAIGALCAACDIAVVEDAACAIGSTYRDRPIGAHSAFVVFSFHPRKVLTTGEGGMIMCRDARAADRLRRLREHGMSMSAAARHASATPVVERYLETGFNYRMTDVQAAIGLAQLGRLDDIVARRRAIAGGYHRLLADLPGLVVAADPPHGTTNYQSFWVLLPDDAAVERDELVARFLEAGISTRRGIMAAHLEPAYDNVAAAPLPVTERLTSRSLILPLFHDLSNGDQHRVVDVLARALA